MCGRTACTLDKHGIQRATCQYSKSNDNLPWVQKYGWQNYQPSYNLSPSQISPVLVNGSVFPNEGNVNDYAITPMRWGLVPSWYKGLLHDSLKNNNCRYEGLMGKPTFKGAANAGYRCVVLADGFYEWKVISPKQKQPYFIYFPQKEGPDSFAKDLESISQDGDWDGPQLLTMAGLFDIWKSPLKEVMYSYSIITMDSSKTLSSVHHRMPAILTGKDEVSMWLDTNRVPTKDALSLLKPIDDLQMHPVSTLVNFTRNNSIDCLKPFKEEPEKKTPFEKNILTSWLIKDTSKESPPAKRMKPDS